MGSNNPFALDASQRYPDINGGQPQYQQPQQQQQQAYYGQPQPQQQLQGYAQQYPQQQQQQQQPAMYSQPTGYAGQTSGGFQPSSQFGQYLQAQGTGLNFGAPSTASSSYAGGGQQQPGASSFISPMMSPAPPQQQPAYMNQMVADLDPFSHQQRQMQQTQQYQQPQQYQTTPQQQETRQQEQYGDHPRTFMRNNKGSLETWNMDAWARAKSLLNQLERAWEGRKKLVMEWQTWSMALDDRETCDKLRKEADGNIDTVAAYTLQVKEIVENYRHSADQFSRTQVRVALNQGLQGLPDWPLTLQPPPKLSDSQPPQQSQQQQLNGFYGQQQPQQQAYSQQQQPQYGMQQNYTGYQQQQQQPQMTGMYGQQGMQQQQPYGW